MKFGTLIDHHLFTSRSSCELLITPLMLKQKRKEFALLDSPSLHMGEVYDEIVAYKLFVCGKTGVGKTMLIRKLLGKDLCEGGTSETLGIETSTVYWPVRILDSGKNILFKITFWDAGESHSNSYNYLLPSCMEDVDSVLYVFSLRSKASWDTLPSLITKVGASEEVLEICVGTSLNMDIVPEVSHSMVKDFQDAWKVPVLTIHDIGVRPSSLTDGRGGEAYESFADVAPFMNRLCELLWYNDQVKAGIVLKEHVDYCFAEQQHTLSTTHNTTTSGDKTTAATTVITFC